MVMRAYELLKRLAQVDPNEDVVIAIDDGRWAPIFDAMLIDEDPKEAGAFVIFIKD